MRFETEAERDWWVDVFIAAVGAGAHSSAAAGTADDALRELRARTK